MTEGEEDDSDDDVEPIAEFRFVPSDKSACKCEWELCFTLKSCLYVEDTWMQRCKYYNPSVSFSSGLIPVCWKE